MILLHPQLREDCSIHAFSLIYEVQTRLNINQLIQRQYDCFSSIHILGCCNFFSLITLAIEYFVFQVTSCILITRIKLIQQILQCSFDLLASLIAVCLSFPLHMNKLIYHFITNFDQTYIVTPRQLLFSLSTSLFILSQISY